MLPQEYFNSLRAIPGPIGLQHLGGKLLRTRKVGRYHVQLVELEHIAPDRSHWKAKSVAVFDGQVWETKPIRPSKVYDIRCVLPPLYGPATRWG